jgi:DedD protein
MAAAIILNEAMLSGPRHDGTEAISRPSADVPLKTYTIDLNRSPGASVVSEVDERAPPPDANPPMPAPSSAAQPPENLAPAPQAVPERTQFPPSSSPQQRIAEEQSHQRAPPAPQPTMPRELEPQPTIASAPAVPTSRGWAVQLGSFASRATADRIVKDLSQQGQTAFVMPVKSGSSTLYRVRIGPFAERDAANEALREVKGRVANAAVVAHP